MSDVVGASNPSAPGAIENVKLETHLNEELDKFRKYRLICDALEECTSNLNDKLKGKVQNIMMDSSCSQALALDEYANHFGLSESTDELTFNEGKELEHFLKAKLQEKCEKIAEILKKSQNDCDEASIIEYKDKLIKEQADYVSSLLNLRDILEEMLSMRLGKLPSMVDQKVTGTLLQIQLNKVKSQIAKEKVRVDVFTETSGSLKAYKEILKDIRKQQKDCRKEIEDLKELKEKYKQVSCKQFDDILKSYLQYKASIEKKKMISETLRE